MSTAWTAALAALLFARAVPARAEGLPGWNDPKRIEAEKAYQEQRDQKGPDPARETDHYKHELNLSPAQSERVHALLVEEKAMFEKSWVLRTEYAAKTEALHQEILRMSAKFNEEGLEIERHHADIQRRMRSLLDEKQKAIFDAVEAQRAAAEKAYREKKEAEARRKLGGDGVQGRFGEALPPGATEESPAPAGAAEGDLR